MVYYFILTDPVATKAEYKASIFHGLMLGKYNEYIGTPSNL